MTSISDGQEDSLNLMTVKQAAVHLWHGFLEV